MIEPIRDEELTKKRRMGPHSMLDEFVFIKVFQKKINELIEEIKKISTKQIISKERGR